MECNFIRGSIGRFLQHRRNNQQACGCDYYLTLEMFDGNSKSLPLVSLVMSSRVAHSSQSRSWEIPIRATEEEDPTPPQPTLRFLGVEDGFPSLSLSTTAGLIPELSDTYSIFSRSLVSTRRKSGRGHCFFYFFFYFYLLGGISFRIPSGEANFRTLFLPVASTKDFG